MPQDTSLVEDADRAPKPRPSFQVQDLGDLLLATGLVLAAAGLVAVLPMGSLARALLVLPIVLVAPGYLLLQLAVEPDTEPRSRGRQLLFSLGLSPAVVGLAALFTVLTPVGFQSWAIVATVTATCVLLAAGAAYRRWVGSQAADSEA